MTHTIQIKHRYSDAVLFEFQATDEQQSNGLALRAALEAALQAGANLSYANLRGANLSDANLSGANLGGANLGGANLSDANLSGVYLRGAYLRDANLGGANLGGANLSGASLSDANLRDANLSYANLRGANLSGASLSDANLRDANLSGGLKLAGPRPILQIGPIGSRNDTLITFVTDQGLRIRTGCFFGTRDEFAVAIQQTHDINAYAEEYLAALALIDIHARIWAA